MGVPVAMKTFRAILAGAAALAISSPLAAQTCLRPAEQDAFSVRALQSQLMVVALSCAQHDQYNAFVIRNQRELGQAYRQVAGHFRRVHGAGGQRQLDQYITTLANAQSQEGIRQGSHFCRNAAPLFQQALAAKPDLTGLAALSSSQAVPNPYNPAACPVRTAQTAPKQTQIAAAR